MAEMGFVGPSYSAPSIYQDDQECINYRPEIDPLKQPGQRGVVALYPTPGLTTVFTLDALAQVRGMRTLSASNYMVVVSGSSVYVVDTSYNATKIGTLQTTTGRVGISDNGLYVMIADGTNRYSWKITTPVLATSSFTGIISGNQINVTGISSGTLAVGQSITGTGVPANTIITSVPSSSNGLGLYQINNSVSNGTVTGITITNAGTGFTAPPTITVANPPFGTTATVTWNSIGVSAVTVTAGGTGYTVGDILTGFGGTYSTACQVRVSTVSSGVITAVSIVVAGTYTASPTSPAVFNGGTGKGCTLTLTFSLNNDYSITNSGSFYTSIPPLTATGGGGTGETGLAVISPIGSSVSLTATNFATLPSTDGAFTGADVVDITDNLFVYNRPNTQQWGCSNLLSPLSAPLQFSSKDGSPDNLISIIVNNREVYLLGEVSSEVWVDVGSFPFPFQRIPGTNSQHGIVAKFSVSRLGDSFAYLSRNQRGQAEIVMMQGYKPTRISNHAVENTLVNQYVGDAISWTYQLEGHEVYCITFPTIDITWAYDVASGMWHKWLYVDNFNNYHRHRGNCNALFNGLVLVGDYQNGKVYKLDPSNYTDDGQEIRRLRRAPHLVADLQRQYFDELQIQFQPGVGLTPTTSTTSTSAVAGIAISGIAVSGTSGVSTSTTGGVNPQAMLRWSSDGGSTWSNEHWVSIGKQGKYKNRAIWRRLGWSRDRVFEVVVSDPVFATIISSNLKATAGEN
jgi:hypothetical protein